MKRTLSCLNRFRGQVGGWCWQAVDVSEAEWRLVMIDNPQGWRGLFFCERCWRERYGECVLTMNHVAQRLAQEVG